MELTDKIIQWIADFFDENGGDAKAIVGISGGTDSSVVAALCVKALGKDRVVGVLLPQDEQYDINYSFDLVDFLGIEYFVVNIGSIYEQMTDVINRSMSVNAEQDYGYYSNTPARIRMSVLYGVAALLNGRVANTCNLSEDYIGYSTKFGDSAGDFSPLANLTKSEVKMIGRDLGLPSHLVDKAPEDGLSGKTDEENFGFTYDELDNYLRTGEIDKPEVAVKIEKMHKKSLHKILPMPSYRKE